MQPEPQPASVPKEADKPRGIRGAAARRAAQAATEAALAPGAILELTAEDAQLSPALCVKSVTVPCNPLKNGIAAAI